MVEAKKADGWMEDKIGVCARNNSSLKETISLGGFLMGT